jgi:hypothetical protein
MKINEITFDSPWSLTTNTPRTDHVKQDLRNKGFTGGLMVYENSQDPSQIIFAINVNGYWEVHHQYLDLKTGEFTSGQKINIGDKINIGLPSTAKKIYQERLNRGQRVRVTAPSELWKTYQRIIKKIVDDSDGNLVAGEIITDHTGIDGKPCISQTISYRGKSFVSESMKISEILDMRITCVETDDLVEINTIRELPQPTDEIKQQVMSHTVNPVDGFQDTYYGMYESSQLIVAIKKDKKLIAYAIGELSNNSKSSEFDTYMIPKNLYSWGNDKGESALRVIKAMIRLSPYPVLSDIDLSPPAKKFLQRKVETGELNGQIFNLKTGEITKYDPDVWITDDLERIVMLEHGGRNHLMSSLLMPTGSWNWRQLKLENKLSDK